MPSIHALFKALSHGPALLKRTLILALVAFLAVGSVALTPYKAQASAIPEARTALPTGVDSDAITSDDLVAYGSSIILGSYRSTNAGQTWSSVADLPYSPSFVGGGKIAWWQAPETAKVYVPATGTTQSYNSLPFYPDTMNASWGLKGSTAVNYASGGTTSTVTVPTGLAYPSAHLTASDGVLWTGSTGTGNWAAYAASPSAAPSAWTHIDGLRSYPGYGDTFVATQTTFLYTVSDSSGLHLCSRPLANLDATPTCVLADSGDFSPSWATIRLQDSTALITAMKTVNGVNQRVAFLWNGSSVISIQLGSLSAINAFRGDTPYLLVRDADQIPSVVKVNSNGTLGSPLPTLPTTTVGPLSMAVTPDRVVAGDGRDASGYLAVWSRSVTASGFGSENLLPRRASDFAASAGRTAVAGMDGLSVYDRGTLQNTFVDSHLVDVSGPFVAKPDDSGTQAEIYTAKGVKVATFPGVDGLLFGSEYVTHTTDADTSGSMHVTVNHVVGGAAPTTVDLPAGTASCELQRVWNDLGALWCDYGQSIQVYNLRTGHLVKSHLPSTGGSLYLAGLGDGYAIITDLDVHYTRVHFMWDLSKDTVTTIPECTWHDPVTDGVGHVACASDTELIWRDYSSTLSMSAPRFLGVLADDSADFSKVGSTWSVDLDATKALKAGTLVISNAGGTVVRTLSTPASSDGSIRGVTWNGLDASGRGVPIGTYTYKLQADATDGSGTVASVDGTAPATGTVKITAASPVGQFPGQMVSLSPSRVLDTRSTGGKLAAGESRSVQVTGVGGVPASGVSAVVLNVTVTETTSGGFLTVSPTGTTRPSASNLNWSSSGTTIPNAVTVKVGTGGKVDLYQSGPGTAQVVIDVAGYYVGGTVTSPGGFNSLTPARILDTRSTGGPLAASTSRDLQVTGAGGVPADDVSAVVMNVTVTETSSGGFLSVYPAGTARPNASNLNWSSAGTTIPNLVVVKTGTGGKVSLFQSGPGTAQVIVDVAGYFLAGTVTQPGMFVALAPVRVLDTRSSGPVTGGGTTTLTILGKGGIPASGVSAVVINTTVTETKNGGVLTVYPGTSGLPTASNLNWSAPGVTIPNLVTVQVGTDGTIKFHNGSPATTQVIADTAGYYIS